MAEHVWWSMWKENMHKTWPIVVVMAVFLMISTINLIVMYFPIDGLTALSRLGDITSLLMGIALIILGWSSFYYKDHYKQLAIKYHKPYYAFEPELGYLCFIVGGFSIILQIFIWLYPLIEVSHR